MSDDPSTAPASDTEELFLGWAEAHEKGGEGFESFVARHADRSRELRELFEAWQTVELALPLSSVEESEDALPPGLQLAPGTELGDYRLVRPLGAGGMGQVWQAEQLSLRRPVALKLVHPGRRRRSIERLQREARAAGRLLHRGIVPVHATGEHEGLAFIASSLVQGGRTLADVVSESRAEGGLPERRAAELFVEIAEALHAAHEAGILHRDIKPSNILIDPDGRPRVTDFGLAFVADEEAGEARAGPLGTYAYMSPEQAGTGHEAIDRRSDVFGLGAVLFEALTGRRAFEGRTAEELLQRVRGQAAPDPRSLRPRLSADLAHIVMKALARDRDRRYPSMRALADELSRFLAHEPVEARSIGALERSAKWARRHPARATGLLGGLVLLVVLGALLAREVELRQDADDARGQADQRALEARRATYLASIRAVAMGLEHGDLSGARRWLLDAPAELRDWEWRHCLRRLESSLVALPAAAGAVHAVAQSADGRRAAAGSDDGAVRVFDARTGTILLALGAGAPVHAVALSGDGGLVAAGDDAGRVRVWDAATGDLRAELPGHVAPVRALVFASDGARLASGSEDGEVRLWDGLAPSTVELPPLSSPVVSLALSGDGARLAIGSRTGFAEIWLLETGEQLADLSWFDRGATYVALDEAGTRVASSSPTGQIRWWDVEGAEEAVSTAAHAHALAALALSADGRTAISVGVGDHAVRLTELPSGRPLATLTGPQSPVLSVSASADALTVAAGCADGSSFVWDRRAHDTVRPVEGQQAAARAAALSGDGSRLAWIERSGGVACSCSTSGGEVVTAATSAPASSLALDGAGELAVLAAGDRLVFWDPRSGATLGHADSLGAPVEVVALAHDATVAAAGLRDGRVVLWDRAAGASRSVLAVHGAMITSLALDGAGRRGISAGLDGRVRLWDTSTGAMQVLVEGRPFDDAVVAIDASGLRAACATLADGRVLVADATTGARLFELAIGSDGTPALAFGSEGRRLYLGSSTSSWLRVHDGATGDFLAQFAVPGASAFALDADDTGQHVLSLAPDGRLWIWVGS